MISSSVSSLWGSSSSVGYLWVSSLGCSPLLAPLFSLAGSDFAEPRMWPLPGKRRFCGVLLGPLGRWRCLAAWWFQTCLIIVHNKHFSSEVRKFSNHKILMFISRYPPLPNLRSGWVEYLISIISGLHTYVNDFIQVLFMFSNNQNWIVQLSLFL